MSLKMTNLKIEQHLPGANKLTLSSSHLVWTQDPNEAIIVPADIQAPDGTSPSAGTVMTI